MADTLQLSTRMLDEISRECQNLRTLPNGGKIILLLEFNIGTGGIVNDIDIDMRVKRKIKHG